MEEQSDEEFTPSVKGPGMSKRPITQPTTVAGRKAAKHHKRKQVQRFSEEETRALIAWLDEGDNFDAFYHATRRTKSTEELSLHLMRELGTERSGMTLRNKLMDMRAKFLALARDERDKGYSLKTCEEYFPGYADFKSIMERRDNFTQSDLEPAKSSDEYEDDDDDEIVAEKPSFDVSHQSIETVDRPMKKQRRSTGLMPTSGPTPRRQDDYATRERERHEMERERHQLEMRRQQLEIERLEREAEVHELRLENEKARLEKEKSIRTLRDELIATLSDSTDNHVKLGLLNALK
ncbi:hypothetical protein TRICI_000018 [Trichomonascus ciferrii]|uniref:Uncharacterized protein n=1 Tax=Trichomonascus ciferrii TaxID=44093 RepID=A0A642VEK9_9ASCO|nr:hypothetical protein TRICI_000018 [Trichomonascus ciferrii]